MDSLYSKFVLTDSFSKAVKAIEFEAVRDAVCRHGIGDDLKRSENGFSYDYEAGNLVEPEVKETLTLLGEEEYHLAYRQIAEVAEAYAEWSNSFCKLMARCAQLEIELEQTLVLLRSLK